MTTPEVSKTADEVDGLCRRAKSVVQEVDADHPEIPSYAHGVYDALRWVLGYSYRNESFGISPLTAKQIESVMDDLIR